MVAMEARKVSNQESASSRMFESLPVHLQFSLLVTGVFLFFGVHNLLQEAIMSETQKKYGVMLGYMEVFGVCVCCFIERQFVAKEKTCAIRGVPYGAYPFLTACLLGSSALSNMSLNYINFPTKVVFRSSKLIPTMLIASVMHKKVFSNQEYGCAVAVCFGLILFAAADWELTPSFHPIGLFLVSASVCSDAILPNAQEKLFRMGRSRLEVTFFTNILTLLVFSVSTLASGDLIACLRLTSQNRLLAMYFGVYTFVAYIAISLHMTVVKRFGGVAAVVVSTGRKGLTLILSFVLFPKPFSWFYPVGGCLVLGGIAAASLHRMYSKLPPQSDEQQLAPTQPVLQQEQQYDLDEEQAQLIQQDSQTTLSDSDRCPSCASTSSGSMNSSASNSSHHSSSPNSYSQSYRKLEPLPGLLKLKIDDVENPRNPR